MQYLHFRRPWRSKSLLFLVVVPCQRHANRHLARDSTEVSRFNPLMTIAKQIEQKAAEKYQYQLADMAKREEQALHDKEQVLREKEMLEEQLREAGITSKH